MRFCVRCAAVVLAAVVLSVLPGCGSPVVEGTVSFDSQPVDGGLIIFTPQDTKAGPVSAEVAGGKYSLPAGKLAMGTYRVEVQWAKKTGRKVQVPGDPGNLTDETVQVIPAQSNSNQSVQMKSGSNKHDFNLKK